MEVLEESVHLLDDGKLVDRVQVVGVGLFLQVFDEGRFVIDKLACKNDKVLLQKNFEFCVIESGHVHDGGMVAGSVVRMRLFF